MAEDQYSGGEQPTTGNQEVTRREFLRQMGAGAAAVTFFSLGVAGQARGPAFPPMAEATGVVFPDPSLCIGCLTCEVVCSRAHEEVGLSGVPRIRIYDDPSIKLHPEIIRNYPDRGAFFQEPCLQCPEAPCLPVCPVDALRVEPKTQARIIDESTCIACGRCERACPFTAVDENRATNREVLGQASRITFDPKKNVYVKCDLCYFREGGPACVERCPVNIRIRQGIVKSDILCLDLPASTSEVFQKLRQQQAAS
ncbi:MAG: 4Fe-4S dicluster domain-containing protein [Chloroflexi bacterium]|nr:4Fe-4S dicluster domain-containing protein [Chloroflexota bacterium]